MSVPLAAATLVAGIVFVQLAAGTPVHTVIAAADVPPVTLMTATPVAAAATSTTVPHITCRHVVFLGDSNLGLAAGRFDKAFKGIGVDAVINTGNGRGASIVKQGTTAIDAIDTFRGSVAPEGRCWILELSAADAMTSAKNGTDPLPPIRAIADAIDGEPTLWITPVLISTNSDWTLAASTAYDVALVREARARPNVTVLDWQDIALQHVDEFQPDGVHYQDPLYDLFVQTVMDRVQSTWTLVS